MIKSPFITVDSAQKAVTLEQLPPEAWRIVTGGTSEDEIADLYRKVAWLYRGVNYIAGKIASAPFAIIRGEDEVTTDKDYEAPTGAEYLDDLKGLLWLSAAGLTLRGQHYFMRERNRIKTLAIRNLSAKTIEPQYDEEKGLKGFIRHIGSKQIPLEIEDLLYFWLPDSDKEIGPPDAWPAKAALEAAGVLRNVDKFASGFFEKGAIKITLLRIKNLMPAEKERIRDWWGRFMKGIKSAFSQGVINADTMEPVVVGEGIAELQNTALTTEKREDICTALGIPQSILFSNAANYAVSDQDKRNMYEDTLKPLGEFISGVFNQQLLERDDLRLVFRWDQLDIFQKEEKDSSEAFLNYVNGGIPPEIVGPMLGLELPADKDWETLFQDATPEPAPMPPDNAMVPVVSVPEPNGNKSEMEVDLDKWRRKSIKALKRGKRAGVDFESDFIPLTLNASIAGALECATSPVAVANIFEDAGRWKFYP